MSRIVDVVVGSLLLLASLPIILIAALTIRLRMGAPVFFRQTRAGRHGKAFRLIKLRTMQNAGAVGDQADEKRLTSTGRVLRQWSIDELPQFWNVIKGDMALVGPRPLLLEYVSLYSDRQRLRLQVRPGITGFAQVMGRNSISWEEKLELDAFYVDHRSVALDVRVLFRTVGVVLGKQGIAQPGQATAERFRGTL